MQNNSIMSMKNKIDFSKINRRRRKSNTISREYIIEETKKFLKNGGRVIKIFETPVTRDKNGVDFINKDNKKIEFNNLNFEMDKYFLNK